MTQSLLKRLLEHPLTRGLPLDDPRIPERRREIIRQKPFLQALYNEWYDLLLAGLPEHGRVLEIGAGGGHLSERAPWIISSDVMRSPHADIVVDAGELPLKKAALDGIVMTDVLHHLPDVRRFFSEADRCLKRGGRIVMIEPWRTPWSQWIYRTLHHEPFIPNAGWKMPSAGPLSGANGALPWIVFHRDRAAFERAFPSLRIDGIEPMMPFSYLLSGGVSMRSLLPGWSYRPVRFVERLFSSTRWSMFARIVLEKKEEGP